MDKTKNFKAEKIGSTALSVKILEKLTKVKETAGKSICKIKTVNNDQGTCGFYQSEEQNEVKDRFLMMTCNHVLPTNSIDEVTRTTLEFDDIPDLRSFRLIKENVKFVWTSQLYDATVVELSQEQAALLASYGVRFLKVGKAKLHAEVAMLQYPFGTLSIAHGDIEGISANNVFYRMGTAPGSSGSPLLTWDCVALAMHNAGTEDATGIQPTTIRKAILLEAVVSAYATEESEYRQRFTTALQSQISKLQYVRTAFICLIGN